MNIRNSRVNSHVSYESTSCHRHKPFPIHPLVDPFLGEWLRKWKWLRERDREREREREWTRKWHRCGELWKCDQRFFSVIFLLVANNPLGPLSQDVPSAWTAWPIDLGAAKNSSNRSVLSLTKLTSNPGEHGWTNVQKDYAVDNQFNNMNLALNNLWVSLMTVVPFTSWGWVRLLAFKKIKTSVLT